MKQKAVPLQIRVTLDYNQLVGFWFIHGPRIFQPDDFVLDVPDLADRNGNGVPDFYETSEPMLPTVTHGIAEDGIGGMGSIEMTWRRLAGSATGTCSTHFAMTRLNVDETFPMTFQLLEYAGTLMYRPSEANVLGQIHVSQRGAPANTLNGNLAFNKLNGDLISFVPGQWTNADGATVGFTAFIPIGTSALSVGYVENPLLDRFGKNYAGLVVMTDGDTASAIPDYRAWWMSIHDPNDANGDGVPDLSDPNVPLITLEPTLSIDRIGNDLAFLIFGVAGHSVILEHAPSLLNPFWTPDATVSVQKDPERVQLPVPTADPTYWRVQVRVP